MLIACEDKTKAILPKNHGYREAHQPFDALFSPKTERTP
jgi:hypothetical protein